MRSKCKTALLFNLPALAACVLPAGAASVQYQGLTNTSLGSATLSIACCVSNLGSSGQDGLALVVSNLGSSGQDGVTIALNPGNNFAVGFLPLDPNNTLPAGAYVQSQLIGTAGTVTSGVLGTTSCTKVGTGNYNISADYTPLGASGYTVQIYNGTALVAQGTGQNGSVCATAGLPPYVCTINPFLNQEWPAPVNISMGTGSSVMGTEILMIPIGGTPISAVSADQITAASIPAITIIGENEGLVYQGLTNTSLGSATLSIACCVSNLGSSGQDGSALIVTNLGSSGQDGVTIALNPGNNFAVGFLPLDPNNTLPAGAYVQSQLIGTAGTVTSGVLGTTSCTKVGTGNYNISADYTPLGASGYTVQIYNGTTLVAQGTGQNGSVCATAGLPPYVCTINPFLNQEWPTPVNISMGTGSSVMGTEILMIPIGGTPISAVSADRITAANIPAITIIGENEGLVYQGLTNTSLGSATLSIACCVSNLGSSGQDGLALYITNLGSSGQDGVTIALNPGNNFAVGFLPLDPNNTLPAGAYVQSQLIGTTGTAGTVTSGVLGTTSCTKVGTGNYNISADYTPLGASGYTVQIYNGTALVAQGTGQNGSVCATAGLPPYVCTINPFLNQEWPAPVNISMGTGSSVMGTEILMIPAGGTPISAVSADRITAANIPAITIIGENEGLVYQGLTNTSLGSATLSIACCVSNLGSSGQDGLALYITNLGSSGQDGVTIALNPGNNFAVGFLPLDPNNTLPAGAYVQSQLIGTTGTAGTVTSGVLGTTSCTKVGTGNYNISADYTPLGASGYTVQIYNGTALVAQGTGQNGSVCATAGLPPYVCTINPFLNQEWPAPVNISMGTGSSVMGTEILMIPAGGTPISAVSADRITAANIPAITIIGENESLVYQGLTSTSLGNASESIACCVSNLGSSGQDGLALYITNLGSGGQDGVSLAIPAGLSGLAVGWQNLDPLNTLPVGAYVQEQVIGTAGSVTNGVLGTVTITKECAVCGGSNYLVTADFSPMGATSYTVAADLNGDGILDLVATNQNGAPLANIGAMSLTTGLENNAAGLSWTLGWGGNPIAMDIYEPDTSLGTPSTIALASDQLIITPQNAPPESAPTAINITAAQVPSITIIGASESLIYQGLTNTSLGYASESIACCVSNLGSSGQDGSALYITNLGSGGQDGVSFAIPAGLSGLDVGWQNLDPSNMLPLGAYVQEQLVGTADGITNGAFGTVTMTKQSSKGTIYYAATANFSPIGASASTVQAWLNGALVAQGTYKSGAAVAALASLPLTIGWGPTPPDGTVVTGGYYLDWKPAATVMLPGLAGVACDHLYIAPQDVSLPNAPTALQIIASQVPSLTVTGAIVSPWLVSLSLNHQTATLQWYGSGNLQESTDLAVWSDITNAFSPYAVAASPGNGPCKFYRLVFRP